MVDLSQGVCKEISSIWELMVQPSQTTLFELKSRREPLDDGGFRRLLP